MTNYKTDLLDLRQGDCMDLMRDAPDGFWDLAIVDPPYGIGVGEFDYFAFKGQRANKGLRNKIKKWDDKKPAKKYWKELFRVSKSQIVFGGNYFTNHLPISRGWVCWDKKHPEEISFSSFELAWTSFNTTCKTFRMYPTHVAQGVKIHPTQKPVALYRWLLANYAKPGQRILDTHLGSGSHAIACHYAGLHLTATELDPDYFAAAVERIKRETAQQTLFPPQPAQRVQTQGAFDL